MSLKRFKPGLLSLFSTLNELKRDPLSKRMLALQIQEELLRRNARSERVIRTIRRANNVIKKRLAKPGNDKATARALKAAHSRNADRIADHQRLLEVFRAIADSIAFIYGDRFDIKQLAQHESAGFLTGKKGARLERRLLRDIFKQDECVAVLNDLTNALRHGDITVYMPKTRAHWPIVVEVKSGKIGSRGKRQASRLEGVMSFLNSDKKLNEGTIVRRIAAPSSPPNLGSALVRVARRAQKAGYAIEVVEPGLTYAVVTAKAVDASLTDVLDKLPRTNKMIVGFLSDVLPGAGGYYPVPLSVGDPEILYRLYDRELLGLICIDLNSLNERLRTDGISVELTQINDRPLELKFPAGAEEGFEGLWLGSHFVGRLTAEFVSLDWFAKSILHQIKSIGTKSAMEKFLEDGAFTSPEAEIEG